jgi:hypothetical protein
MYNRTWISKYRGGDNSQYRIFSLFKQIYSTADIGGINVPGTERK